MDHGQPQRWSRLLFGAVALLALSGQILEAERAAETSALTLTLRGSEVVSVDPAGSAARAGFLPGDRVLRVGDRAATAVWEAHLLLRGLRPEATAPVLVLRAGRTLELRYTPGPPSRMDVLRRLAFGGAGILTLLIGVFVYFRKPRPLTLIFAALCFGVGIILQPPYLPPVAWVLQAGGLLQECLALLVPPLFVHLFLLFPQRHPALSRRPRLQALLYAPSVLLLVPALFARFGGAEAASSGWPTGLLSAGASILWVLGIGGAIALFAQAYRRARTDLSRRKVRVVLWGTVLGSVPLAILLAVFHLWPQARVPGAQPAALSIVLVPLSFGYAIVRHGIFDATLIVRRSLAFSVLAAVLVTTYFLMQLALGWVLGPVPAISPIGVSFFSLLAAGVLFLPARRGVRSLLAGVIGAERRESESLLAELRAHLGEARERADVVRLATDSLARALPAERIVHFARHPGGGYEAVYLRGLAPAELVPLQLTPSLSLRLAALEHPCDWGDLETDLPYGYLSPGDQRTLAACAAELILPMRGSAFDQLILVGRALPGEPFDAEDLRLAESIVGESRVALAEKILSQRMLEEEHLQYEMDAARDLQEGLLPKPLPQVDSLEVSGFSVPCRGVGGDYYDWFRAPSGKLLLAIGDASGKGVPGAILAANLQALVRAAGEREHGPAEMVRELNRRLCELQRPERFITFCIVRVDPWTGAVDYCNAGHPSPLLTRHGGETEDLTVGGLPLGIRAQAEYDEGRTHLRAGDLLLLLTDGVTERRRENGSGGEEFGRARLQSLVSNGRRLSARALQGVIFSAVREFSATPLDDDTTLLIVKML